MRQRYCYARGVGISKTADEIEAINYGYIDRLYDKPLDNFRKLCIWKIFVPYYINVKKLSAVETFDKTRSWLDRANSIKRLKFNPTWTINYTINRVGNYVPPFRETLEFKNKMFYERLKTEGIIS